MEVEQIQQRYEKFTGLLLKCGDRGKDAITMCEALGERLIMCPAAIHESIPGAHPGGLIDTSLRVLSRMRDIQKALGDSVKIYTESLIIVGLLHNIGMVGSDTEDYLLPQDSDWHRKQGRLYRFNESLPKMSVPHRSLFLIQKFGIYLSLEEWTAIAISGGPHREENRFYVGSEPPIAHLLSQAKTWTGMRDI